MNTIISGLLSQKASSPAPEAGEERWFSWIEKQGKSGKSYIKIKNESKEYGGKLCTVIDAEKTDFVDSHGNVSFNVGFEPKESGMSADRSPGDGAASEDFVPMTHDSKGAPLAGVDEAKRHIIQAANLWNICANTVNDVIQPNFTEQLTPDLYQAAIGTLFIEASRAGLVDKMPNTKLK